MASAHNQSLTGTAALGAAFHLSDKHPSLSILTIDKKHICPGNLLNNSTQNYSYPTCFAEEYRTRDEQSGCCLEGWHAPASLQGGAFYRHDTVRSLVYPPSKIPTLRRPPCSDVIF